MGAAWRFLAVPTGGLAFEQLQLMTVVAVVHWDVVARLAQVLCIHSKNTLVFFTKRT